MLCVLRACRAVGPIPLVLAALPALAHEQAFEATLSGAQATPPSITAATGTAEMHYNADTNIIEELHIFTEGILLEDLLSAHIRIGGPGVAGPAAFTIQNQWWGPGALGILLDVHVVGPIAEEDEAALLAGDAYLNIETRAFPTGEIRGQLLLVPAPGATGCACLFAAAAGARRRRLRRA